jgi:hypothetical protein
MGRPSNAEKAAKLQEATSGQEASALLTADDRFKALEAHCLKLEEALSRIAVLTGNGNHLRELGIERWVPGKKHMNKKYA